MGITCQMCGTGNGDKQKFCSACGKPLDQAQEKKPPQNGKARTVILGGAAAKAAPKPVAKPVTAKPAAATTKRTGKKGAGAAKTVMGMPAVKPDQIPAAKVSSKNVPVAKVSTPPGPMHVTGAKTVLGMASPLAATAKPKSAHKSTSSRTVMGMPSIDFDTSSGAPKQQMAPDKPPAKSGSAPGAGPSAPTEALPKVSDSGDNAMDMETEAASMSPFANEAPDFDTASDEWPVDEEEASEPRGNSLLIAVVAAGIVAILVVGTLLYLLIFDAVPAIRPQIFPSPDGKSLMVALELPKAPPGATVQVAGQTVPVTQGTAKATLALSQMQLGLNDIVLVYTEPGESPEKLTFPIVLRHTIKDDFSGLSAPKPYAQVIFRIAPEVRLTVENTPVQVANNTYIHRVMIDQLPPEKNPDGDFIMHKVPFQLIDAAGGVEQGEHVVAIPVTKLQIDRPAPNAMVVTESLTCAGSSEPGATVTVNGNPVGVTAVRFSTTVPLAQPGEHVITVKAQAPGKAPRTRTLKVSHVESLEPAIAEWSKDLDKQLDYPTIGRDPNAHVGKKAKLNGRVVNINTVKGVTAFILYVGEGCPSKSKCAVYVVFKGETEAGLQSWVDVFGTVRGTHAVDMQNGVKIEVPAIDAEFVVKSDPKLKKKRKR